MKQRIPGIACLAVALACGVLTGSARAQDPATALAKQLVNPLASLTSVPFQYNLDSGIGPDDGTRSTLNLQPVVPVSLGPQSSWKLISRTVLPFVSQSGTGLPGAGDLSGVGDLTQSVFVTPVRPGRSGWMLGAGPVVQLPTGSERMLTTDHWSVGPTAIALRQAGPWTYGALANHLWSVGGDESGEVSMTFVQPFLAYVTKTRTTFALNTESTYDWKSETWSVPVHLNVSQLLKVGRQPVSPFVGARYWAESPEQGPQEWGLRAGVTLLFVPSRPKGGANVAR